MLAKTVKLSYICWGTSEEMRFSPFRKESIQSSVNFAILKHVKCLKYRRIKFSVMGGVSKQKSITSGSSGDADSMTNEVS